MTHRRPPSFSENEQAALGEIDRRLRAEGWTVTVAWMLAEWDEFSGSADGYDLSIEDYANDLTVRDGLAWALRACPQPLRGKLLSWIEDADRAFIAGTQDDDGALGRFYPGDESSEWWWKRRPAMGPLADSLPS